MKTVIVRKKLSENDIMFTLSNNRYSNIYLMYLGAFPIGIVYDQFENDALRRCLNQLGFVNQNEYNQAYPGCDNADSRSTDEYISTVNGDAWGGKYPVLFYCDKVNVHEEKTWRENVDFMCNLYRENINESYIFPDVKSTHVVRGPLDKIKKKYYWFCEDWGE